MTQDAERVRAVLGGDRSAFGDLYDRHARWVRAILYGTTRDLATAHDLAQDVFLRAFKQLGALREPERFGSWLMGITRHAAVDWQRGRMRDRHVFVGDAPDRAAAEETSPDGEVAARLRQAVESLPPRERDAVYVFYLHERSAADACTVLNLSRPGLYRVLARARQRLERIMKHEWEKAR